MADKLFARLFGSKSKNEKKKEKVKHALTLDDLDAIDLDANDLDDLDEPRIPHFTYNFDCEKNEDFSKIDEDDEDNYVEIDDDVNEDENVDSEGLYEKMDNVCGDGDGDVDGKKGPFMNQMFHSLDEAGNLFRGYAIKNGFSIKIQSTQRRAKSNEIYARMYVYRLSGKIVGESSGVNDESRQSKRRRDIIPKCDCKVRMYVIHRKHLSLWEITSLELNHNHGIVTPSKMNLIQRERHVTAATKSLIKTLHFSGVPSHQMMNVFGNIQGGAERVGFSSQHVRNVVRDERKKKFEFSDAQGGLDLLYRLNEESGSNFFIKTQLDEEQRLKCLVWVDPRSLMAYKNFGDVVTFDTTYRTNRYAMPFVPFTGVNHHYQSVIFGFALMRDENATTFKWIIRTWLEAVGNKYPLAIITDQDQAMANAIANVLPFSAHLLCSWHISNKFPEKLSHYYSTFPDFKVEFNDCIYNSLTEDIFEERWESLMEKYELRDHPWLQSLYELKEKWIISYTRNTFSAGQGTTSRSEGMNAYFDSYVSSCTGIKEFIENSQKALSKQFIREKDEDYVTFHRKRCLRMHTTLEYHGSKIYTKEMFKRFQEQLVESSKYFVVKDKKACEEGEALGDEDTYYCCYRQMSDPNKARNNYVAFNKVSLAAMCMCRMMEHLGIPCRHILAVLNKKRIPQIPEAFILRRWTMHANRVDGVLPYDMNIGESEEMSETDRFNSMTMLTMSFCQSSIASKERYNYAKAVMDREIPILESMSVDGVTSHGSNVGTNMDDESGGTFKEPILDPIVSNTKGRKKDVRFKSPVESLGKKARKCKHCNMEGHDKRTCPTRLEEERNKMFE